MPRMTAVEMFKYANVRQKRQLTAAEFAYLYAFSGGHFRILQNILNTAKEIVDDSERMSELADAKIQFQKDYTIAERKFLLQCARMNQKGSAANAAVDIENLLLSQDVIATVADFEEECRFKLNDPLLKTILNDEARRVGTKVNVRGLKYLRSTHSSLDTP